MNQDNNFQQYGFDHYDQVPLRRRGFVERVFGGAAADALRSPLFATVLLLVIGVGVAGFIISSMSDESSEAEVPVVKASTLAFKEAPSEPGGMMIENQGSTIYMSMMDEDAQESAPIENLLADVPEIASAETANEAVEAFVQQVEEAVSEETTTLQEAVQPEVKEQVAAVEETIAEPTKPEPVKLAEAKAEEKPRVEPPKMAITHSAGSSPETLEFVRSVLDKKDGSVALNAPATRDHTASDVASQMAEIEPAVGSQVGVAIKPGDYFVQLASVTNAAGAEGEWGKLQKAFPTLLVNVDHRVKSADLGERGTYYRIQAGPMSKESANAMCEQIKAQKPGGCLVTK